MFVVVSKLNLYIKLPGTKLVQQTEIKNTLILHHVFLMNVFPIFQGQTSFHFINPCPAELFQFFFLYFKLELLMQFPSSNDEN